MKKRSNIKLDLAGSATLQLEIRKKRRLIVRLDGAIVSKSKLKKRQARILFHLAEVVRLRGYGSSFALDEAVTEASVLVYKCNKDEIRFAFGTSSEPVPEDLHILLKELSGLTSF